MSSIGLPPEAPKPSQDCLDLHRAFKGPGCDAHTVIRILAHRDASQRAQIRSVYKNMFEEDICTRLKNELHHHFEKAMLLWMTDGCERDARILHEAMKASNTTRRNRIFVEVLCRKLSGEINLIAKAYHNLYGRPLQDAIKEGLPGACQKLFGMYLCGTRDDVAGLETHFAEEDAKKLHSALFIHVNETAVAHVLTGRNCSQLCRIFDSYRATHGLDIYEAIKRNHRKGKSEFNKTVMMLVKCISNSDDYFAEVLYKSMKGLGTDDDTLIRVIVTHAEDDLQKIKAAFYRRYNIPLSAMVHSDTTMNYRKFLLALIGAPE